jgi:UDP-N-acetylglucosamine 4,6-dehydratase
VVALSTDKASSPVNLYGATKLVSDKLFVAGSAYAGSKATRFAVVRYGNVVGSRGSVIPFFLERAASGVLPLTDPRMTRFWLTLDQAVDLVLLALSTMRGGEIFVPKIPSMRMGDLAEAVAPGVETELVGLRPGEKLHEEMISETDALRAFDRGTHYVIVPELRLQEELRAGGERVPEGFRYRSDTNELWLDADGLRAMLDG